MYFLEVCILIIGILFDIHIVSAASLIFHKKCRNYKYIITIDAPNETVGMETTIKHYFQKDRSAKQFFYQSEENSVVEASCIENKKNYQYFIFREHCYGNACPENIYGLFDPQKNKLLISPKSVLQDNSKEVTKILGFEPPIFEYDEPNFCCNIQLWEYKKKAES